MGPTNVALVKLFQADLAVLEVEQRLANVSRAVRALERKVTELGDALKAQQTKLRETQSRQAQLDLDIQIRSEHIEKLRTQQQSARTHKEYSAFLLEINAGKIDRSKVEEESLRTMEEVEKLQASVKEQQALLEAEQQKLAEARGAITGQVAALEAELAQLRPIRDERAAAVPAKARQVYEKMVERFEGEAMAPLMKPDRRLEEYACGACNMDLFADVYNRLHSRDDLVPCPSCKRLLYIPADLPPETALNTKGSKPVAAEDKPARAPRARKPAAEAPVEAPSPEPASISEAPRPDPSAPVETAGQAIPAAGHGTAEPEVTQASSSEPSGEPSERSSEPSEAQTTPSQG